MKQNEFALSSSVNGSLLARVLSKTRASYVLGLEDGRRLFWEREDDNYYVGDILEVSLVDEYIRNATLSQRKNIVSKAKNETKKSYRYSGESQVMATNVDQILIVMAVNQKLNVSKLERYCLVFGQDNIELIFVLTKIDLRDVPETFIREVEEIYPHVRIISISVYQPDSLRKLASYLPKKNIGLLLGSSGAGKSSLINQFRVEKVLEVNEVRSDGKGRPTTTSSQFYYSSELDYYFIDTPGFKGIDSHDAYHLEFLFADILDLAEECRFSNCRHEMEKGCAVKKAVEDG